MNKLNLLLAISLLCSATACGQSGLTQSRAYRPPEQNAGPSFFESVVSGVQSITKTNNSGTAESNAQSNKDSNSEVSTKDEIEKLGEEVTIVNRQLFNKYNIDFKAGMKWVYLFKISDRDLAEDEIISELLAEDPDSVNLIDALEVTIEVRSVDKEKNKMSVIRSTRDISDPKRQRSVATSQMGGLDLERFSNILFFDEYFSINLFPENYAGSLTWKNENTRERISVAAGNYDTELISLKGVIEKKGSKKRSPLVQKNKKSGWLTAWESLKLKVSTTSPHRPIVPLMVQSSFGSLLLNCKVFPNRTV